MDPGIQVVRVKCPELVQVSQYCPECPILEVKIPDTAAEVTKLVLKTVSHDQGWCNPGSPSSTWLEALITTDPPLVKSDARRLLLYNNNAGDPQLQERNIVISPDSEDAATRGWIASIRPGERIQITPRAKFLRWVHFVHEVELEVWWVAKDLEVSLPTEALAGLDITHARPKYRPLDREHQEIRLLEVHSGGETDPLHCTGIYASIADPAETIPYTALSYCWGDRNELATLKLSFAEEDQTNPTGPMELQIQANLYNALKHIRREKGPARVVWADAICINQDDVEERSQQVSMMREIYQRATDVRIWLGEESEQTQGMLKHLQPFLDFYMTDKRNFLQNAGKNLELPHGDSPTGSMIYGFVGTLFWHAWFSRVWVLQEVFNARTAFAQIGKTCLPWEIVLCVGNCLAQAKKRAPMGISTIPDIFLSLFEIRTQPSRILVTQRHDSDMLALLIGGLNLGATDPRDKIFAVASLHADMDLLQSSDETRPDYTKQPERVFSDFTKWWIRTYQSLRILSAIHANVGRTWQKMSIDDALEFPDGRPSWSFWHSGSSSWANSTLGYERSCTYRASGSAVSEMRLLATPSDFNVLSLSGLKIGIIHSIQRFPWGYNDSLGLSDLTEPFEKVFDATGVLKTWTPDGYTSLTSSPDRETLMNDHLIAHQEFAIANEGAVPCLSPGFLSAKTPEGQELRGLCPHTAKVGDSIVVLIGGNVPYLLRERSVDWLGSGDRSQYGFIGECFVRNYMAGEAITEWKSGKLTLEEFEII